MKYVRDTKAGRSISAYIVLNRKGEQVATVQAHFADGGAVTVNVWNDSDAAALRCWNIARKSGQLPEKAAEKALSAAMEKRGSAKPEDAVRRAAHDLFGLQGASAGGYGYDKFTAALAGRMIDGHTIANHCGSVPEDEKRRAALMAAYLKAPAIADQKAWDAKAERIGARFYNWSTEAGRYTSLHFVSGLERLAAFGYRVIQAI